MCTLSTGQLTDKKHTVRHQDAEPLVCPARTCPAGTHEGFGEKQLRLFFRLFFVLFCF